MFNNAMKLGRRLIVFAVGLIFCVSAAAKGDETDRYIETEMRNLHIPAVSLAVVRDGDSFLLRYRVGLGGNPYWFSFRIMKDGKIAQIYNW